MIEFHEFCSDFMSDGLKPCPFCGGKPEFISECDKGDPYRSNYVWCPHCGFQIHQEQTQDEAIKAWNKRVNIPNNAPFSKRNWRKYAQHLSLLSEILSADVRIAPVDDFDAENYRRFRDLLNEARFFAKNAEVYLDFSFTEEEENHD